MEYLFNADIRVNKQNINYKVVFDHEGYHFTTNSPIAEFTSFCILREHDEWVEDHSLPEDLICQAIDTLEKYLLKQH